MAWKPGNDQDQRQTALRQSLPADLAMVEWPTLAVAFVIHVGWMALTWWWAALPVPVLVAVGGWLIARQGSLRHETIHGHPRRWRRLNAAIGAVPLSLWLPYAIYRRNHLTHHASERITDPLDDPESRYVASDAGLWRRLADLQATLPERLVAGSVVAFTSLVRDEVERSRIEPWGVLRDWVLHLVAVVPLIIWLEWTGVGVARYLLLAIYPGTSLTLLRSYAEHRADRPGPSRAATVARAGPLALLYLNNNLHAAHHERPGLAWYRLPAYQRLHRRRLEAKTGPGYRDYGEIVRRFAFPRHGQAVHPGRAR